MPAAFCPRDVTYVDSCTLGTGEDRAHITGRPCLFPMDNFSEISAAVPSPCCSFMMVACVHFVMSLVVLAVLAFVIDLLHHKHKQVPPQGRRPSRGWGREYPAVAGETDGRSERRMRVHARCRTLGTRTVLEVV